MRSSLSVFEKGDEKLKTACRGTGREIVSPEDFSPEASPPLLRGRRMGLLMRLCRGKFIGFAPDHPLPSPLLSISSKKMEKW